MITLIVAMDKNNLIGNNGKLPWKIAEDMEFFKKVTTGSCVIMGRKTYESIGKPLPHRKNVVISKTLPQGFLENTLVVFSEFDMKAIQENSLKWEYFIIGGREIYQQALEKGIPEKLLISRILGGHVGDTYFPDIPKTYSLEFSWELSQRVIVEEWKRC